jgi:SHS family lactate transporter-like MFS transporter
MRAERESALAHRQRSEITAISGAKAWFRDVRTSLKENWFLFIYMIVLMTGFNSCSHGSQDLYPTFLKNGKSSSFDKHY